MGKRRKNKESQNIKHDEEDEGQQSNTEATTSEGPSTSHQCLENDAGTKGKKKPTRETKRSGIFDNDDSDTMQFFKPISKPLKYLHNANDSKEFKSFIQKIDEEGKNVSNFECGKVEKNILVEYSFATTNKIRQNGCYSRAIAEIVAKISKSNPEFPEMIAKITMNLINLHLKNKWFILEYLEFITMLNYYCKYRSFRKLISFIFFAFVNDENCFKEGVHIIDEFIDRNEEKLKDLPLYVAGDIFSFMKENYIDEEKFYEGMLKDCDPDYESLKHLGETKVNPSFKRVLDVASRKDMMDLNELYDEPQDLRILNVEECAKLFTYHAVSLEAKGVQLNFIIILLFMLKNQSKETLQKFLKINWNLLKKLFFEVFIKGETINNVKTAELIFYISLLSQNNLMSIDDFKPMMKIVSDKRANTNDNDLEIFYHNMASVFKSKVQGKDAVQMRFLDLCADVKGRRNFVDQEVETESEPIRERKKFKREVRKRNMKKKKNAEERKPYNHAKDFPAFKQAVEDIEYSQEEFDISKFNLTSIPDKHLEEYVDFMLSLIIEEHSPKYLVFLADLCINFGDKLKKEISNTFGIKFYRATITKKYDIIERLGRFIGLLYVNGVLEESKIGEALYYVKNVDDYIKMILEIVGDDLYERDPELYNEVLDNLFELDKKGERVYPSFKELVKTIENDEELYLHLVKVDDPKACAEYILTRVRNNPDKADRFAQFFAHSEKEFEHQSIVGFELIASLITIFENFMANDLTKDYIGAGALFAELHNLNLIGFRIVEDSVKHLENILPEDTSAKGIKVLREIVKRIQKKSSKDPEMKKFFEKDLIQQFVRNGQYAWYNYRIRKFNQFLKEQVKSRAELDKAFKFMEYVEEENKEEILKLVVQNGQIDRRLCYRYCVNGFANFFIKNKNYNKFFIDILKELTKINQTDVQTVFNSLIDYYYDNIFVDGDDREEEEREEDILFGEFIVELGNNSILPPIQILALFERYLMNVNLHPDISMKPIIHMMKVAKQKIFNDREKDSIGRLEYLQEDLIKRARKSENVKDLADYLDLFKKLGISWMKPRKRIAEVKDQDLEEEEDEEAGPSTSKKSRKRNRKKKKNQEEDAKPPSEEPKEKEEIKSIKVKKPRVKSKSLKVKKPKVEVKPPKVKEISNFDVIGFKLLMNSLDLWPQSEQNEKIKNLKVETKTCIKIMAKEFLKEVAIQSVIDPVKVAAMIQENFPGFKKVLEKEVVKNLTKKLSEGFGDSNWIQISEEDFKVPEDLPEDHQETAEDEEPPVVESNKKKKKKMMRRKKKQVEVKVEEVEEEKLPTQAEIVEEVKDSVKTFNLEAMKAQNLMKFAIELFNFDWISFENFRKFLELLIEHQNFKTAYEMLKLTSHKLSQHMKVLNFNKILPISASQISYEAKVFKQLESIKKLSLENSQTMKVLESSLQNCELKTFTINFLKIENFELLVDQTLRKFLAKAILNDSKEFAKVVESLKFSNQKQLIKILLEKFKTFIEEENSAQLYEILGIFDFFASLLAIDVAKLLHFDEIFDFMMRRNSKFVKIFFEIFGAQFEKFYKDNLKFYLRATEIQLKLSRGKFAEILREILELKERNWRKSESSEDLTKVEEILSKLNEENCQEISIKLQKLLRDDFKDFIETLWKFLLKDEKDLKLLLEICQQFKSSETFKTQLEEFLTYRRQTFLRIEIENIPENARKKLKKVSSFIEKLAKFEILSEKHFELWNEPHIKMRL